MCFSPRPLPLPSSFPFLAFSLTFSPLSFFPLVTNFLYQSSSSKNKIQFSFIDLKLEVQNLGCVICSWYTHRWAHCPFLNPHTRGEVFSLKILIGYISIKTVQTTDENVFGYIQKQFHFYFLHKVYFSL